MAELNEEALDVLVNYYYPRAKWLQDNCNWGSKSYTGEEANEVVNDPLMQHVEIYDCYTRNAAGFSNVLQDLWCADKTPKYHHQDYDRRKLTDRNKNIDWDMKTWLYVFMCHRIMGSGASFEADHGYRNNVVQYWGQFRDIQDMCNDMVEKKAKGFAMFTSIGNQPPAPKKGVSNVDFMVKELPSLIEEFTEWLTTERRTHQGIVDFLNLYNKEAGHRKFNFQYSAFAMDCSDYYPETTDEFSHCYIGNNAVRCLKLMSKGYNADAFMDVLVERTGGKAKDLEDVLCDFVRFGQNYIPRKDMRYAALPVTVNNSRWDSGWEQRGGEPAAKQSTLSEFF